MRKLSLAVAAAVILLVTGLFALACGSDDDGSVPEITGIYASDVEVDYDGRAHGIVVMNTQVGDRVFYSDNGVDWDEENKLYIAPDSYLVYYKVERDGYTDLVGSAELKINRIILSGITAKDVTVIYDGNKHGITVEGTEAGDAVTYSSDGESEVGEYTVYYNVERTYGEFGGSCKLTVLPRIQGDYVNPITGTIKLTDGTAIIDGRELRMEYGVSGEGVIGDTEFSVADGVLIFDGVEYLKLQADEKIFELAVNGKPLYVKGAKTGVEISVEFVDGHAEIKACGVVIYTVENVNYVENLAERDYASSDVRLTITDDCSVTLTHRAKNEEGDKNVTVVYDGEFHDAFAPGGGVLFMSDGAYTSTPPRYKDVGKYVVEAVIVKDGYLPKTVTITIEIAPNIYGTYYNDGTIIELSAGAALVNYDEGSLEYSDGQWTLNGDKVETTDNGIKIGGADYVKRVDERIVTVKTPNGMRVIRHESKQYTILWDGSTGELILSDDRSEAIFTCVLAMAQISVTVNGAAMSGIPDGDTLLFIIGAGEIGNDFVMRVEIK